MLWLWNGGSQGRCRRGLVGGTVRWMIRVMVARSRGVVARSRGVVARGRMARGAIARGSIA